MFHHAKLMYTNQFIDNVETKFQYGDIIDMIAKWRNF